MTFPHQNITDKCIYINLNNIVDVITLQQDTINTVM